MPAPGYQHRSIPTSELLEDAQRPTTYTVREIATLQSRLEKQLGPEFISFRPGPSGSKIPYLAAEKCINLANQVFGFNGWSSSIRDTTVDYAEENPSSGKINLGISATVRVTLRDGTYHEDVGYGRIENCAGKGAAFEKAKKEATTDALKRALRNFGNILGNCLYDKDYLSRVTKFKVAPPKVDMDNLHRHPDYDTVKKEPASNTNGPEKSGESAGSSITFEPEDEFGAADFDDVELNAAYETAPDDLLARSTDVASIEPNRQISGKLDQRRSGPSVSEIQRNDSRTVQPHQAGRAQVPLPPKVLPVPANGPSVQRTHPQAPNQTGPAISCQQKQGPQNGVSVLNPSITLVNGAANSSIQNTVFDGEPAIGFYTARAAESIQNGPSALCDAPIFNPHSESPSIRKTAGVDHSKTKPINRDALTGAGSGAAVGHLIGVQALSRANYVNPQADVTRKIGMPGAGASPLQNRGSYKPPQMLKRPIDSMHGSNIQANRAALNDVTMSTVNVPSESVGDYKRPKLESKSDRPPSHGVPT